MPYLNKKCLLIPVPPESVDIQVKPKRLKDGDEATLVCQSGSSNPPAIISWWKDGLLIPSISNGTLPGEHAGKKSINVLKIIVSPEDNNATYICKANNEWILRTAQESVVLQVRRKSTIHHT